MLRSPSTPSPAGAVLPADPIRVGLIGYGFAGETFHAPFIEAVGGLELAAVVTSDPERRRRSAAAHPGAVLLGSVDELWPAAADLGLELVVVAAPNRAHLPVSLAALDAGLAVVVDKPLAPTAAEGRRLVEEAARRGLLLTVFHNRRWDGDFLTVRRLAAAGALGDVWRFESRYERWRPHPRLDVWRERADPAEGGGILLDLGSHLVDQAIVLLGRPRSVYAEVARRRPGAEVDDDVFIAVEHDGGARSHLWASSVVPRPGPRFRVLGGHAGYEVGGMDVQEEALKRGERPGGPGWGVAPPDRWGTLGTEDDLAPVPTEPGDYGRFYEGVVAALRAGGPPPVDPLDAVLTLEVLDAARASARSGQTVVLGLDADADAVS
ncbi:MAG TPA: Gfo/Idh/MocA family oxidoreductase [Acidimicrobiales bacterium]